MDKFKNFVKSTIQRELNNYDESNREKSIEVNYDVLKDVALKHFQKGHLSTAREIIVDEVFYT